MKTIYKNIYGNWQDVKPPKKELLQSVEVDDDILVGFMNSLYYIYQDYSRENYDKAMLEHKKTEARKYLATTDYVAIQRLDEKELGLSHTKTEEEYREILQKRQDARLLIRGVEL